MKRIQKGRIEDKKDKRKLVEENKEDIERIQNGRDR